MTRAYFCYALVLVSIALFVIVGPSHNNAFPAREGKGMFCTNQILNLFQCVLGEDEAWK